MEVEWKIFRKIFQGLATMGILNQIQQMMGELQCDDTVWDAKSYDETYGNKSKTIEQCARRFPRGHWSFLRPGSEKKWYGTYDHKLNGSRDRTADEMLLYFAGNGHPVFRGTNALERRE